MNSQAARHQETASSLHAEPATNAVFLYTATNQNGARVTERIEATNSTTARYALELRGYSAITFHTDEWENTFQQWMSHEAPIDPHALSAEQEVENRTSGGAWAHILFCFREWLLVWVPLALWNSCSVLFGPPYGWFAWLGFLCTGVFSLYFMWTTLPGVAYQRLLMAKVWARWGAVYRWVTCLRFLKQYGNAPLPDFHLDGFVAKALAAEGQLNDAVTLLRKYENEESVPRSFYYSELGSVYDRGRAFDKAIECRARAVEVGTGSAAEHIDYALTLIVRLRNPQCARTALAAIADKEIIDLAAVSLSYCWGVIALEEGKLETAKTHLLTAFQQASPYATNILMIEFFMELKTYLVIIFAKLSDQQKASKLFHEVKPFLIAHQEVDLMQRCLEALGEL